MTYPKESPRSHDRRGREWIKAIMREMDTKSEARALAALRAMLPALRDRLRLSDSADFAAQLPIPIRRIYFEGWDPKARKKVRSRDSFLQSVQEALHGHPDIEPLVALNAVFTVISGKISEGEIMDATQNLSKEIQKLQPELKKAA